MTRSTCSSTSGGIFDPDPDERVASHTSSSWANRPRSSSSCVTRLVRLRFHSANSSRKPCHSPPSRRSISSDGLEESILELSSWRALDSRVRTGRSC